MGEQIMRYPAVIVNKEAMRENARITCRWADSAGITVAGVIKGANGLLPVAEAYVEGGAKLLASSRLEQLKRIREADMRLPDGTPVPLLMIRIPMLTELDELAEFTDYTLISEVDTIRALNEAARKAGRTVGVILMADLGDLREGWFDESELDAAALLVENEMDCLELSGIGTNLGCVGTVVPTEDNMLQLACYANHIEKKIGRELKFVSGGATTSLLPVFDGVMPEKINMLRVGAGTLIGSNDMLVTDFHRKEAEEYRDDVFTLKAEVVEVKHKPSHPIGELGVDAYGHHKTFVDRGIRKRAIIAVGGADYGDFCDIICQLEGAEIIGASTDHTILDIENVAGDVKVGDVIDFGLKYPAVLGLTASENVHIYYI